MDKNTLILGLTTLFVITVIAVYFAQKGHTVRIGTPLLNAQIN
jgi:hypothetical protein